MSLAGWPGSLAPRPRRAALRPASRRRAIDATAGAIVIFAGLFVTGCPGGSAGPSTAADAYIAQAEDEEERLALIEARDEIDEEMREEAAELDAEIERLHKENQELRRRLDAPER